MDSRARCALAGLLVAVSAGGSLAWAAGASAVTVTVGRQNFSTAPNNNFGCTAHEGESCSRTVSPTALSDVFNGDIAQVPTDGAITSWRVRGSTDGDGAIILHVLRPVGAQYTFVGEGPAVFSGSGAPIPLSPALPVAAGDFIGVELQAANAPGDPDAITRVEAVNVVPAQYNRFDDFVSLGATVAPSFTGPNIEPYFNADVMLDLPVVSSVSPASGSTAGGQTVTIGGNHLAGNPHPEVRFGGVAASISSVSNTQVTAVTPPSAAGTVDVTVTTAGGTSATSAADRFTFVPPTPAAAGFVSSRSTITVNRKRRFSFSFRATPGLTGNAVFKSLKRVRASRTTRFRLGPKVFTVPASGKVTLRMRLSKKKFRILKLNRRIRMRVTVTLENAAGGTSKARKRVTLKAPPRRR